MHISTMMKYSTDLIYSIIDTANFDTKFTCTAGVIASNTIDTTSITNDLSTYADNQAYQVTFTSVHKIFKGGYIKVKIPSSFTMSSASSAVAQFEVQDVATKKTYAQINNADAKNLFVVG